LQNSSELSDTQKFNMWRMISCAISPYPGSSLPLEGDNIRLLGLLPNKHEAAPLRCKLRNYSLQKLGTRTHLYEALSYTWGDLENDLEKRRSISVNKQNLAVTENLHAALLRLRDRSLERILWIDAICIDQENLEEREQQVRLMAKIYSKAHRVIVWLGKEARGAEGALENIRLAAIEESTDNSKEMNQRAILNLLQRPWFQRIWVREQTLNHSYQTILTKLI
jgi:hypothetical protein